MGKVMREVSTDRQTTPKSKRMRRKKDLDKIHSKMLIAKQSLDNVGGKDKSSKGGKPGKKCQPKICSRLLPTLATGIYRNGTKSKNIRKGHISEDVLDKARLESDALKLFNGNTSEDGCLMEVVVRDNAAEQSPCKDPAENNCAWKGILQESPVLGKEQRIFDTVDIMEESGKKMDEMKGNKERKCKAEKLSRYFMTKNHEFWNHEFWNQNDFYNKYYKFCKIISTENFKSDILQGVSDPTENRHKRLRDCNNQRSQSLEPFQSSVEHQACTSRTSQSSSVEFEIGTFNHSFSIENILRDKTHVTSREDDESRPTENYQDREDGDVIRANPFRHMDATYDTSNSNSTGETYEKTSEEKENEFANPSDKRPITDEPTASVNVSFQQASTSSANPFTSFLQKGSDSSDSREEPDHRGLTNKNHFYVNVRDDEGSPESEHRREHARKASPLPIFDNAPDDVIENRDDQPSTDNARSAGNRMPAILRRSNVLANRTSPPAHSSKDHRAELLFERAQLGLFGETSNAGNPRERYERVMLDALEESRQPKEGEPWLRKMSDIPYRSSSRPSSKQFELGQLVADNPSRVDNDRRKARKNLQISFDPTTNEQRRVTNHRQQHTALDLRKKLKDHQSIDYPRAGSSSGVPDLGGSMNLMRDFPRQLSSNVYLLKNRKYYTERSASTLGAQKPNILFNEDDDGATTSAAAYSDLPRCTRTERRAQSPVLQTMFFIQAENANYRSSYNPMRHYNDRREDGLELALRRTSSHEEDVPAIARPGTSRGTEAILRSGSADNCVHLANRVWTIPLLSSEYGRPTVLRLRTTDDERHVSQPIKYMIMDDGLNIQRVPVYENEERNLIPLADRDTRAQVFHRQVQQRDMMPLNASERRVDDFPAQNESNAGQVFVEPQPQNSRIASQSRPRSFWQTERFWHL